MQPVCSPVLAQPITSFLLSQLPVWPIFLDHTIEVLLIGWWISFGVLEHRSLNLIWFKVMETLSQLSYSSGCSCLLVSGCYRRAPRSWIHSWPFREDDCDNFHFMCWFQELYDRTSYTIAPVMDCDLTWSAVWTGTIFCLVCVIFSYFETILCPAFQLPVLSGLQAVLHHPIFSVCYSVRWAGNKCN